jgi:glc operon protein GlcG
MSKTNDSALSVLNQISTLGACGANLALTAATSEADRNGWRVTIAVVDAAGHLLAFRKMDGTSIASINGALEKARSAAHIRRSTGEFQKLIDAGNPSYLGIHWIASLEGGVPIAIDGVVVGAVAASGVQAHEDHQVAEAGVLAVLSAASEALGMKRNE